MQISLGCAHTCPALWNVNQPRMRICDPNDRQRNSIPGWSPPQVMSVQKRKILEGDYRVSHIVGAVREGSGRSLIVRWEGYNYLGDTREPEEHVRGSTSLQGPEVRRRHPAHGRPVLLHRRLSERDRGLVVRCNLVRDRFAIAAVRQLFPPLRVPLFLLRIGRI